MKEPLLGYVTCAHPGGLHKLAYWEWPPVNGNADAPVIICVHGLTRNGRDFDALADHLSGANYRVVCPDMIGRGKSDWVDDPNLYQVPQYVADCVTLIARLNAETVSWVGTSMGGLIGMGLASLPGNPIKRLLLNDVGPVLSAVGLARIKAYIGMDPTFDSFEQAEAALRIGMASFGPHTDEQFRLLSRHSMIRRGQVWGGHSDPAICEPFRGLDTDKDLPMWEYYDPIICPTLVLRGEHSDVLTAEVALQMSERGPRVEVVEFAGIGHAPTLIADEQIKVVRDFLDAGR